MNFWISLCIILMAGASTLSTAGTVTDPIPLWPGTAPGEMGDIGEEHNGTKPEHPKIGGKPIVRLANVTRPTITVFRPDPDQESGCAVIVCPGGAYQMLAYDHEGTEVAEWLNSLGITAVLLKYRVPARKGLEKYEAALQDAQRAVGLVRHRSAEWKIDPKRIGILGFSAGGHLSAAASTRFQNRTYDKVDEADQASCRPDFTLLIYPAYMTEKGSGLKLAPEIMVTPETPPAFVVHTQDDPVTVESSLAYIAALHAQNIKTELHVYPFGGHGYGLRRTDKPVTRWPEAAALWFKEMKLR